jgi:hypothetical protein
VGADSDKLIADAVRVAVSADVVVLAVGIDGSIEGENGDGRIIGYDSLGISLPGNQSGLVAAVALAAKKPVVLVVTGSSADLAMAKANAKVGAILWMGYAGQAGAAGVADVIFGKHNPDARLTSTFYPASFVDAWTGFAAGGWDNARNASYFDANMRPNGTTGNPGRSHRFYTGNASYKFGDGLSYSSWSFEHLPTQEHNHSGTVSVNKSITTVTQEHNHSGTVSVNLARVVAYAQRFTKAWRQSRYGTGIVSEEERAEGALEDEMALATIRVRVRNTGLSTGSSPLLAFVTPPKGLAGEGGVPLRALVGFDKVRLSPGEAATASLALLAEHLAVAGPMGGRQALAGQWGLWVGSNNNDGVQLQLDVA